MFWSFGPIALILPFIMIFIAVRAIRSLTDSRRNRYFDELDEKHRAYESIAVDVKRLNHESGTTYTTDTLESKIFKLALKQKGIVTVSDVVIETGLSVADSEKLLEGMIDGVHVKMELTADGMVRYEFPEIIQRFTD